MIGTIVDWIIWAGIVGFGLFLAGAIAFMLYSSVAVFLDGLS